MSRYLTVTCSAAKCTAEGRVQLHGIDLHGLPKGWLLVSTRYDGNHEEFCSWACVVVHGASMQRAHEEQREWQSKPLPVKPIDAPKPDGALL